MLRIVFALAVALGLLAAPALAQDKPTLTIYTYDAFAADYGPGPGLKAGFEKICNCTVDFVATDSSIGALRRVQLEGSSTKADIVLGLDTSLSGEARATGLFAPHG
ncbi:MAG TPA: thiamine ABC transporter substrate-binding protein, partial [Devosia sp.]|nr:thiamine ABC transporter substrate-binding protein [Devosia sp.]